MNNDKGLTLIEVLAAVVILGMVVTLFVGVSSYMNRSRTIEDHRLTAQIIAENELNVWKEIAKAGEFATKTADQRNYASEQDPDYEVTVLNLIPMQAAGSVTYGNQLDGVSSTRLSMQSIVWVGSSPQLLTVIVSWEAGP